MHSIALVNQKGGVGKSTTAVNLSAGLAQLGRRVLLIDLDPQAHSTVALGLQPKKQGATIYSLLSGAASVKDVIKPLSPGLSIIPSTINLAGGEAELTWQQNPHFILKRAMSELAESEYDFAIVDSPPQLGFLNVNSLAWVKHVIIPITCEFYALHGLSLLVETVDRIKAKLNPDLEISGVVACQYNPRRGLTKDVLADLETHFPGKVMKSKIRVNVRLAEAPSHGMSVHHYAPTSNGSKDYLNLARELLEVLPAAASPEVEAGLAAIQAAKAEEKGLVGPGGPAVVAPHWTESPAESEPAPASEASAVEAAPAPEPVVVTAPEAEATPVPEPTVAAAPEPEATPAPEAEPAMAESRSSEPVDPLADLMVEPQQSEAPAAPVEMEMPKPAEIGRVHEPTSPMIASAAELAAMAPPADAQVEVEVPEAHEPTADAEEPVRADADDSSTRLGFDPYAESSAHLEEKVETEPAKPEFVSPLPATPVSELRAAIASDAPAASATDSTVKPVPGLPSVKAAALPFTERLAMAGLKPIVTSKPGAATPRIDDKKGLFSKLMPWKR